MSGLILALWVRLLSYMRAFRSWGVMVRSMVVMGNDLFRTVLASVALLWIGFALAFFTLYGDRHADLAFMWPQTIITIWRMTTGEGGCLGAAVGAGHDITVPLNKCESTTVQPS